MNEPQKLLEGTPISLRNQIVRSGKWKLSLFDEYLLYECELIGAEPKSEDKEDHGMGWDEDLRTAWLMKCHKRFVLNIEISFRPLTSLELDKLKHVKDYWTVTIICRGSNVHLYVHSETRARKLFSEIDEWLFKEKLP